jgi:hypothetical protein
MAVWIAVRWYTPKAIQSGSILSPSLAFAHPRRSATSLPRSWLGRAAYLRVNSAELDCLHAHDDSGSARGVIEYIFTLPPRGPRSL